MDLFDKEEEKVPSDAPLARRLSPRSLDEFVGQEHLLSKGRLLRRAIEADRLQSAIFYGPPGTGKTAIVRVIAKVTKAQFRPLNALTSGVAELRSVVEEARQHKAMTNQRTIVFIDEIHRFNRPQQDALLPHVEEGIITFIGATVLNPFFALSPALLSRSLLFEFKSLSGSQIKEILLRALEDERSNLKDKRVKIDDEALKHLILYSEGDARRALNTLELGILTTLPDEQGSIPYTLQVAQETTQKKALSYEATGDDHYDTTSAFIKSMRGSAPDAALYWMAKMLNAGEDPRYIARRIAICSAEDVGIAEPMAMVVASSALQIAEFVGMPEAQIPLAMAAVFIATAPKSNSAYLGISRASEAVEKKPLKPVPLPLKDAHYPGAKTLGHGKDYLYPHDFEGHYIPQDYGIEEGVFYQPTEEGYEASVKKRLEALSKSKEKQ